MNAPSLTLQLKNNAEVSLTDGTAVGRVDRVVLDPRTRDLTHIVVRKGLLFTTDKVVPVDWIVGATEEGVTLRALPDDMESLPEFEAEAYVRVNDDERRAALKDSVTPLFWYPLGVGTPGHLPAPATDRYRAQIQQNIPAGTVALKVGAKVVTRDGQQAGHVAEVLSDARTEQTIGLVISQGMLFKEKRRVPMTWVDQIAEDEIRLLVGPRQLEALGFQAN